MNHVIEIVKLPPTIILFINLLDEEEQVRLPEAKNSIPVKIPFQKFLHKEKTMIEESSSCCHKEEYQFYAGILLEGTKL